MKNILKFIFSAAVIAIALTACQKADSDIPWGETLIYMPQANYSPYAVPNSGNAGQSNRNYSIDTEAREVNIFLGVYRSGLQPLEAYTVDVQPGTTKIIGTTLLPAAQYTLPLSVTCPDGKRDVTFYLTVNLDFLLANPTKDFSLPVTIANPSRYTLNDGLSTATVRINTKALIDKEGL